MLKAHSNENGTMVSEAIKTQELTNFRRLKKSLDVLRNEDRISSTDIQNLRAIVIALEGEFIRKSI